MKQLKETILKSADTIINQIWFNKAFNFLKMKHNVVIKDIFINNVEKHNLFNILHELELFLNSHINKNITNNTIKTTENTIFATINNKYISRLVKLLVKINKYQSVKNKSKPIYNNLLRKYLEVDNNGKIIKTEFFKYIKTTNKLEKQSELLINPYTSIINLNEIYLQTKYHISFSAYLTLENNDYYNVDLNDIILFTSRNITTSQIENYKDINDYLSDIVIRLFLIQHLSGYKTKPEPTILYLIDYDKEFMEDLEDEIIFTSSEINTGVTNGREVIITREEECMKTLIHEYIHFYHLDFCNVNIPENIKTWIFNNFNLVSKSDNLPDNSNIYVFEAYTEWLASILHILSRIIFSKLNSSSITSTNSLTTSRLTNLDSITKSFKSMYFKQVKYTFHKCSQILSISKCSKLNEFTINTINTINTQTNKNNQIATTNTNIQDTTCELKEETNVFCYYYLKLALYLHVDKLIKLINGKNGKFIINDTNFNGLLNIFKEFKNDNIVKRYLDRLIKKYYKQYYFDMFISNTLNCNHRQNSNNRQNSNSQNNIFLENQHLKTLKMVIIE